MISDSSEPDLVERVFKLKAQAVPDHEVVHIPPEYIVIGNFATRADPLTVLTVNDPSGLTEKMFDFAVREFVATRDLKVTEHFGDSIVVKGNVDDLRAMKSSFGQSFSFAHFDGESLEGLIRAEADYQKHGHIIPGSEKDRPRALEHRPIH